jgi:benzodiazapine receptor
MERRLSDWAGNIAAFILVIVVNGMANAIPIGGQTTGQVSAKYESLFTPAGYTFSIWGVIYLALTVYVFYQAMPKRRENVVLAKISPLFKLNCLANALWIVAWHYDFLVISLLLMFVILATLIRIYRILGIADGPASTGRKLFVHIPFSLYTGWITVATIANMSAVQAAMGWNSLGLSAIDWTLVKLAIAGAIGAIVILRRGDIAYGLVIAWAAMGIVVKQAATPIVSGAADTVVILALLLVSYEAFCKLRGR